MLHRESTVATFACSRHASYSYTRTPARSRRSYRRRSAQRSAPCSDRPWSSSVASTPRREARHISSTKLREGRKYACASSRVFRAERIPARYSFSMSFWRRWLSRMTSRVVRSRGPGARRLRRRVQNRMPGRMDASWNSVCARRDASSAISPWVRTPKSKYAPGTSYPAYSSLMLIPPMKSTRWSTTISLRCILPWRRVTRASRGRRWMIRSMPMARTRASAAAVSSGLPRPSAIMATRTPRAAAPAARRRNSSPVRSNRKTYVST